jgi:hypothetical protein
VVLTRDRPVAGVPEVWGMCGREPGAWLGPCVVAAAIVIGCGSTPAASPAEIPKSTEFAIIMPTASTAPATPTALSATPTAIPAPTMDPALIGTWTGEADTGRLGPIAVFAVTYEIGPCGVIDERCGTWEWRGTYGEAVDWAPYAIPGEAFACRGQLRYKGTQDGVVEFLANTRIDGRSCL